MNLLERSKEDGEETSWNKPQRTEKETESETDH